MHRILLAAAALSATAAALLASVALAAAPPASAWEIGFTFGSEGECGHGIYATAPARFDFCVE